MQQQIYTSMQKKLIKRASSSYEKFVRRLSKQDKRCCQFNLLRGTLITPVQHLVASCSPKRIKFGHGDSASTAHR